jgi:hypothetical protein
VNGLQSTTASKTAAGAAEAAGVRRAVLIGINGYENVRSLRGCVNDVIAIRQFLTGYANFAPEHIQLLIAPGVNDDPPDGVGATSRPTKEIILKVLNDLAEELEKDDEVLIYYSGHGTSIANPADPAEQIGAMVPVDANLAGRGDPHLLTNLELNRAIGRLANKAPVTVVLDACHSGGATRGVEDDPQDPDAPLAREIILSEEQEATVWAALRRTDAFSGADEEGTPPGADEDQQGERGLATGGWGLTASARESLIVLSGCRDVETSIEAPFPRPGGPRHGALTWCLLDALRNQDSAGENVPSRPVTWGTIYADVLHSVRGFFPGQTPTLEGPAERTVFGGDWRPYEPGFTVTVVEGRPPTLDGGAIHGLDEGAEVAIYPPKTPSFEQADNDGVQPVKGMIVGRSSAVQSTLQVPHDQKVEDQARARLTKPSNSTPLLNVRLDPGLPPEVVAALKATEEVDNYVQVVAGSEASFEVRSARDIKRVPDAAEPPAEAAWVLVPYTDNEANLTWNDVIAWVRDIDTIQGADEVMSQAGDEGRVQAAAILGQALGEGLVHWAKYWGTLNRRNLDANLRDALTITLEVATRKDPDWDDPSAWRAFLSTEAVSQGVKGYTRDGATGGTVGGDPLRLVVRVAGTAPALSVGLLLCSNDGNIFLASPPQGVTVADVLAPGREKRLGIGNLQPFVLGVERPEQSTSLYTFKAFASNGSLPVDLNSLRIVDDVQTVLDRGTGFGGIRGGMAPATSPTQMLWTTVELPVLARR